MSTLGKNTLAITVLLFVWVLVARLFRPELVDYVLVTVVVNITVLALVNFETSTDTPASSRSVRALVRGVGMSAILYGAAIVLLLATVVFSRLIPMG